MSEGDYEYELMRSELLGLPPPEKKPPPPVSQNEDSAHSDDAEDYDVRRNEEIQLEGEQMGRVSGGLDELNSILSITQKKINRFKTVCGSFTSLLKLRMGAKTDGTASDTSSQASEADCALSSEEVCKNAESDGDATESKPLVASKKVTQQTLDLEGKLGSQIDKLDAMLMKAEQAEMSMSKQNKEMRIFLNK